MEGATDMVLPEVEASPEKMEVGGLEKKEKVGLFENLVIFS